MEAIVEKDQTGVSPLPPRGEARAIPERALQMRRELRAAEAAEAAANGNAHPPEEPDARH